MTVLRLGTRGSELAIAQTRFVAARLHALGHATELVKISTEGDRAVDVFHLPRNGAKLSPDMEQNLRADLEQAVGVADEAR